MGVGKPAAGIMQAANGVCCDLRYDLTLMTTRAVPFIDYSLDMVLKKRSYGGFHDFLAPVVPKAPRSLRRRSLHSRSSERDAICAFELLAEVADKLLQESESSTSSTGSEGKEPISVPKEGLKHEAFEVNVKPVRSELHDQGSCAESELVAPPANLELKREPDFKELPHSENDSGLERASVVTTSDFVSKVGTDVRAEASEEKNGVSDILGKPEAGSLNHGSLCDVRLGDNRAEIKTEAIEKQSGVPTAVKTYSVKNRVESHVNTCVRKKPTSSVQLPFYRDPAPSACFPRHRGNVKIDIRDDDEKFFRYNHHSTSRRAFGSRSRAGYRRIRKMLTSRYRKVAPKLKDYELSNATGCGVRSFYHKRKNIYMRGWCQAEGPSKKRKLFHHSSKSTYIQEASTESISNSPEKSVGGDKRRPPAALNRAPGVTSSFISRKGPFSSKDSHVKFSIKSFKVPELYVEVPETATVGSLKRTVMEAVKAILQSQLHVGVLLEGKKVRDDNRTLQQTGISQNCNLESLGFTLEPSVPEAPPSLVQKETPLLLPGTHQLLSRSHSSPIIDVGFSNSSPDPPPMTSLDEKNQESVTFPGEASTEERAADSKALVLVPAVDAEVLSMVPLREKQSKRYELSQRRTRRPFSVSEVEALVEAVETLGAGRWRDVKMRAFDDADHRTYVDLKDKWKTLVHTASIAPQQRRGEPVPQDLLDRVLAAHAYWSQHQSKQHGKQQKSLIWVEKLSKLPSDFKMFMDGSLNADYCLLNSKAMKCNDYASILSDQSFLNAIDLNDSFVDWNSMYCSTRVLDSSPRKHNNPPSGLKDEEGDLHEDSDFSDLVLKYINQMLMEEDIEEKSCMLQESAALHAAEKSFYDALMVKELPSNTSSNLTVPFNSDRSNDYAAESISCFGGNSSDVRFDVSCASVLPSRLTNFDSLSRFQPSYSSLSSTSSVVDGFVDSPVSTLSFPDMLFDGRSAVQFQKGLGDASRYIPDDNGTLDYIGTGILLGKDLKDKSDAVSKWRKKHEINSIPDGSRGRKNHHSSKDLLEDGRSSKQSAVYVEPNVRSKMFDEVLLCDEGNTNPAQSEFLRNGVTDVQQKGQSKGSNGVKGRGKKQGGKKDVVDLRTLLSLCAQSVSANDQRGVADLLKRIREHASPTGDGMQRLAHYFSAGLEARMAGSGTVIYKALLSRPTSAVDVLKAYHLFLGIFPFTKLSHFVSNKTIMRIAQNKKRLHIVDFGILYGFQWPCLIQRLSTRPGGPPELRITGIDFPCPGFRPSQRVEETGSRLANYAETFGVPFKFKAIAQKWETIKIEDLELDNDETLVVNCAYRFRNLLDETVMVHSPRNKVLDLIRKMNPEIFIQGIVNGSYSSPFFVTRFREALFFFSSLFDLLEATVARDTQERMLIEKTIWGREAMNVIACEGGERIERPETYKQWQVRNQRAGFRQIPFDEEILKMAKDRARSGYHKDFMIDEDGHWTLQGWKGRILYAISSWKPAY
ncbi:LOW QUALITY PROTEIN: hypothetical protein OSB04_017441 [Centaurea solstitialis]|uniref:Uncharacterized protein n=1 Tax=Centaurea solstitialis TaxID=347529 RepID=A0AA38TG36_9ASTR|nr:LOW QUALITY PROTEIN: hypothetical protein OSB04_017441 [Centaurea solstitialis]